MMEVLQLPRGPKRRGAPMAVVAVINPKGGTGKTTLALHLAGAARGAVVDLDPCGSAALWADIRVVPGLAIQDSRPEALPECLDSLDRHGVPLALLDTPPQSERAARVAAVVADLILVPCGASVLDLQAIPGAVEIIAGARAPALAVRTAAPVSTGRSVGIKVGLEECGLRVARSWIGQREVYREALGAGRLVGEHAPGSEAAAEVRALWQEVRNALQSADQDRRQAA